MPFPENLLYLGGRLKNFPWDSVVYKPYACILAESQENFEVDPFKKVKFREMAFYRYCFNLERCIIWSGNRVEVDRLDIGN